MVKRIFIISISVMILFGVIFFGFGHSSETFYYSVNSYIKENEATFFDLYMPKSYYYGNDAKETLKEKNNIKVYYRGKPIDNFHVVFEIDGIIFSYFVEKTNELDLHDTYEIIQYKNYDLYCLLDACSIYCQVDDKVIYLHATENSDTLKQMLISIMKDSIDLYEENLN